MAGRGVKRKVISSGSSPGLIGSGTASLDRGPTRFAVIYSRAAMGGIEVVRIVRDRSVKTWKHLEEQIIHV